MVRDSITEEVREIRHRLAAQFDNDVGRIGEELRRREAASGRRVVHLPRRLPRTIATTNKPMHGSGGVAAIQVEHQPSPPRDR